LWVAAVDEARIGQLSLEPANVDLQPSASWETWPPGESNPRVRHREVEITNLNPRQTHSFRLMADGNEVAAAAVTTLPAEMPVLGEKPFTALLGSCFAYHEDKQLKVGSAFSHLPHQAKPDVKILAGDQVYLDSPWFRYAIPHSEQQLRDAFMEHYVNTWSQTDGFARLLSEGANYFSSDDHEFWNNAPNRGTLWVNTWTAAGRKTWFNAARELYRVFQTPRAITTFSVPPLSFLIADTRMNRDADRTNFMNPPDLDEIDKWVQGLPGPGVLVIGQPLLQTTTGFFKGNFGDWNLPDFKQYSDLVNVVGTSKHSLVILTGDVHFGRIARSSLRSGGELIEIISSPMSLVDKSVEGTWTKAPEVFPSLRPETITPALLARSGVVTETNFAPSQGHFLTLEFTRRGAGAHLRLRFWPVFKGGVPPPDFGKQVWERALS
jgi:hypothetical protein